MVIPNQKGTKTPSFHACQYHTPAFFNILPQYTQAPMGIPKCLSITCHNHCLIQATTISRISPSVLAGPHAPALF